MKPKVYIETSIPSFYHETRGEADMLARRQWTRQWWDNNGQDYLLVTSLAVIGELEKGNYPIKADALNLVSDLPLVAVEEAVADIVAAYIGHQ